MRRGRHGKDSREARPQLVAVAVTASKSSQNALRWAADHLLSKVQVFIILHVRQTITSIPTPCKGLEFSKSMYKSTNFTLLEICEILFPLHFFRFYSGKIRKKSR